MAESEKLCTDFFENTIGHPIIKLEILNMFAKGGSHELECGQV